MEYQGELTILIYKSPFRCDRHYYACISLNLQVPRKNNSWSIYFDDDIGDKVDPLIECSSESLVYDGGESDERLNQLYNTLVSCSNIRSLSLSLSQSSCTIGDTRRSFGWKKDDRSPPWRI
jgi:hypothetical protein